MYLTRSVVDHVCEMRASLTFNKADPKQKEWEVQDWDHQRADQWLDLDIGKQLPCERLLLLRPSRVISL